MRSKACLATESEDCAAQVPHSVDLGALCCELRSVSCHCASLGVGRMS